MPNLRWSFADIHMHLSEGGWGRQTTAREPPVATEVAGVNMRPDRRRGGRDSLAQDGRAG
jgi:hypothetical protein